MDEELNFDTLAVRAGITRSQFGEHAEAMYLTSSYVFDNAEQAAGRFQRGEPGLVYSRFTNPTVNMFQERLAALEGAEAGAGAGEVSSVVETATGTDSSRGRA
jgi:O-succinylhomoserine sulfhydrylase